MTKLKVSVFLSFFLISGCALDQPISDDWSEKIIVGKWNCSAKRDGLELHNDLTLYKNLRFDIVEKYTLSPPIVKDYSTVESISRGNWEVNDRVLFMHHEGAQLYSSDLRRYFPKKIFSKTQIESAESYRDIFKINVLNTKILILAGDESLISPIRCIRQAESP